MLSTGTAIGTGAQVPRVTELATETFLSDYLGKNLPIIVTDAMRNWKALEQWSPDHLVRRFGDEKVQVYGDLFRLVNISTLSQYIKQYFGRDDTASSKGSTPYVRWYCHLADDERVPWADEIFMRISEDWARPEFFPADSFVLPFCAPTETIDPSKNWFPARGLFISARGARTRLHADPWCSDALLCQIYGDKDFVMYEPSQARYLFNGEKTVDIEAPDMQAFPDFEHARSSFQDTLRPGEILLVPSGWYHHFKSVTDCISLTWNFVHLSRLSEFLSYLSCGNGPTEGELKQLAYAYFDSPSHRPLKGADLIATLIKHKQIRPAR